MILHYVLLNRREDLTKYFDELCEGARLMISKTGGHGQSAEMIIKIMMTMVEKEECFLLVGLDEDEIFKGFAFAIYITGKPGWVDFIGMWSRPGVARGVSFEAFELLRKWAMGHGASKILAGITRSPRVFYRFFHEPLGFKPVGLILEYEL